MVNPYPSVHLVSKIFLHPIKSSSFTKFLFNLLYTTYTMENKKSIWPFVFTYGTAMGLLSVILSIIFYLVTPMDPEKLDTGGNWIQTLVTMLILGVFIYWATVKYPQEEKEGYLSYGGSLKLAMAMSIPFAIISAIYIFVFFSYIEPDLMRKIAEQQANAMAEKGMSDEQIEKSMGMMSSFNSPIIYTIFGVFGSAFQVFLIALITSIFTRKEPVITAE